MSERTKGMGVGWRGGVDPAMRMGRIKKALRPRIYDAVGRSAAYVWRVMRNSVAAPAMLTKKKKKVSKTWEKFMAAPRPPGQALRSVTGVLKKAIGFSINPDRTGAIIGPEFVGKKDFWNVHEYGGTMQTGRGPVRHYPARPTARLALAKARPGIGKEFRKAFAKAA